MTEAAKYSAAERIRSGRAIEIRALKPTDEEDMLAAVDRTSAQSLYRRFFGGKRHFSESERAFFLKVDFVDRGAGCCCRRRRPTLHRRRRALRRRAAGNSRGRFRRDR